MKKNKIPINKDIIKLAEINVAELRKFGELLKKIIENTQK